MPSILNFLRIFVQHCLGGSIGGQVDDFQANAGPLVLASLLATQNETRSCVTMCRCTPVPQSPPLLVEWSAPKPSHQPTQRPAGISGCNPPWLVAPIGSHLGTQPSQPAAIRKGLRRPTLEHAAALISLGGQANAPAARRSSSTTGMASVDAGPPGARPEEDSTLHLRIVAVFVILVGGLLGSTPPLFIEAFKRPDSATTRVARAFVAGVSPPAACCILCSSICGDQRPAWARMHLLLSAAAAVQFVHTPAFRHAWHVV